MKRLEIFSVLSAEARSKWTCADHSGYQYSPEGANVKDDFVRSADNSMNNGMPGPQGPTSACPPLPPFPVFLFCTCLLESVHIGLLTSSLARIDRSYPFLELVVE